MFKKVFDKLDILSKSIANCHSFMKELQDERRSLQLELDELRKKYIELDELYRKESNLNTQLFRENSELHTEISKLNIFISADEVEKLDKLAIAKSIATKLQWIIQESI